MGWGAHNTVIWHVLLLWHAFDAYQQMQTPSACWDLCAFAASAVRPVVVLFVMSAQQK